MQVTLTYQMAMMVMQARPAGQGAVGSGVEGGTGLEASSRQAAPGELEVVRQFLNTRDVEEGTDEISTPEALRTWLAAHDLDTRAARPTRKDVRSAEVMRESLRAMTLANNGEQLDAHAIKDLN